MSDIESDERLTDETLASRCSEQPPDEEAWRELYRRFHRLIGFWVWKQLGGEAQQTIDDVSAEVIAKIYSEIHRYDARRASLSTFLRTLARNHVIDYQRRVKGERDTTEGLESDVWDVLPSRGGFLDLETEVTRHVVRSIGEDRSKLLIFKELAGGKKAYQIAAEQGLGEKRVYQVKSELLKLVKEFLDAFVSETKI